MPYLAGSALKGKFRHAAYQIGGADLPDGEVPCRPPGSYCREEPFCDLCEIFGSPMQPGGLLFEDAYPLEGQREILRKHMDWNTNGVLPGGSEVRASTALDPRRNVVKRYHLFSTETISPLVVFETVLRGKLTETQEKLIRQCALVLTQFGSGASRGLGFCRYEVGVIREDA